MIMICHKVPFWVILWIQGYFESFIYVELHTFILILRPIMNVEAIYNRS